MAMDPALRALNHFGLGARIGERRRLGDPRGWMRAQLDGDAPALGAPEGSTPAIIAATLRAARMGGAGDRERQEARQRLVRIAAAESRAALTRRVTTDRPLVERLVAFWSNHLCISAAAKITVAPLAGSYEREVIRPHVLGRFEEMLLASARHPAMLFYLDNFQSIGPTSPATRAVRRPGAQPGLNENYARELLELHSLGVEGGYTQQDVIELARILTGWTVSGVAGAGPARLARADADGPLAFVFRPLLHEPGAKTVLGVRYEEGGAEEGERAIRALARHPSTATFVATKLARHFVADEPPAAAVERLARVFRDTDGDLRALSLAIVELPEAWSAPARKLRPPHDWLVAVLRALSVPDAGDNLAPLLRQLRQPLWSPPSPKGYGDTAAEWADPDSLLNRAELARTLARRVGARGADPVGLLEVVDVPAGDPLRALLSDSSIPVEERFALTIAGPAFQWR